MVDGCGEDCSPAGDLAPEEFALWASFVQAHAALARGLDDDLRAAHGLPLSDFSILLWLAQESCARMRMAALAGTVQLSPSGLSRAIARLEARGLVGRQRCAADRRGVDATLTAQGRALVDRASATHAAAIRRRFVAHLSAAERQALGHICERVIAANGRTSLCTGCPSDALPHPAPGAAVRAKENDIMAGHLDTPEAIKAHHAHVIAEFRANTGQVGGAAAGAPLLLLTTTGAKSGRAYTTPVTYTRDFSRYVVIAAKRGAPANPDWYHNLAANPNVTVEIGGETFRAVARVAEGAERQRLFDQMAAERPNFSEYQSRTARQLPVIVLERVLDRDSDYPAFNRDIIAEFRARDGEVGGIFAGLPVLLLTTTGARSGQPRVAPLLYGRDGDRLLLVASKGGSPTHPDWYRNLAANPEVSVEVGTESFSARASVAQGAERQRLFAKLKEVVPMLEETQAKTTRQIPVVVLERTG